MPCKLKFPASALSYKLFLSANYFAGERIDFLGRLGIKFHDVKNSSVICGCNLRFSRETRDAAISVTLSVHETAGGTIEKIIFLRAQFS